MDIHKKDNEDLNSEDTAKVPSSISDFAKKDYSAIAAMFESAGFTNVRCVPLNDLTIGLLKSPGIVESITVNGETVSSGGRRFPKNTPVVISYHSLNRSRINYDGTDIKICSLIQHAIDLLLFLKEYRIGFAVTFLE
jgi:hypothetical protein